MAKTVLRVAVANSAEIFSVTTAKPAVPVPATVDVQTIKSALMVFV